MYLEGLLHIHFYRGHSNDIIFVHFKNTICVLFLTLITRFLRLQIDLDVNRTYRDHIMFRERYNQRQSALFHVLAAYSVYNTELGYCQGNYHFA